MRTRFTMKPCAAGMLWAARCGVLGRAHKIVLVTSGWHARRASRLLEAAHGDRVLLAATGECWTTGARLRELVCWLFVPVQVALARRSR